MLSFSFIMVFKSSLFIILSFITISFRLISPFTFLYFFDSNEFCIFFSKLVTLSLPPLFTWVDDIVVFIFLFFLKTVSFLFKLFIIKLLLLFTLFPLFPCLYKLLLLSSCIYSFTFFELFIIFFLFIFLITSKYSS